jgi:hypothetical protein
MSFLPSADNSKKNNHEQLPSDKLINDAGGANSPGGKQAGRLIELIRHGHQIMKTMIAQDTAGELAETDNLMKAIRALDMSKKEDVELVMSLVVTAAVTIPPTAYGDDYKAW